MSSHLWVMDRQTERAVGALSHKKDTKGEQEKTEKNVSAQCAHMSVCVCVCVGVSTECRRLREERNEKLKERTIDDHIRNAGENKK